MQRNVPDARPDILIDIRHSCATPGLLARKIWEKLFREVEGWKFDRLDSMLCDLRIMENLISNWQKGHVNSDHFWWYCYMDGYTQITSCDPICMGDVGYRIDLSNHTISLTRNQ